MSVCIQPLEPRRLFNAINGFVFNDRNDNATYESAGPDIAWPGVTVYLDANDNGQLDAGERSTVTASYASGDGGGYHFDNIGVGTFRVRVIPPANYAQTFPADGGAQVVTIDDPNISTIGTKFGIRDLTQSSRIAGRAYSDTDASGTRNGTEPVLANVTVWVDLDNDGGIDAGEPVTTTDASGVFQLNPLNPNYTATYHVRAVAPAGLTQTAPAATGSYDVTIDAGNATAISDDFGFVDRTPPSVVSAGIVVETKPHVVRLNLSEPNANGSFTVDFALVVTRLSDNTTLSPGTFTLQGKTTAVLSYVVNTAQVPSGQLPDGNYRARLTGNNLRDAAGNTQPDAYTFDFFVLTADANHDRKVDLTDFTILAANFNASGKTYSQGNFDYDASGNVDLTDFTILAAHFNQTLAPPAPAATSARVAVAAVPSTKPAAPPASADRSGARTGDADEVAEDAPMDELLAAQPD